MSKRDDKLQVLMMEYRALRDELTTKMETGFTLFALVVGGAGAAFVLLAQAKTLSFFLLGLPLFVYSIQMIYLYESAIFMKVAERIQSIETSINELLDDDTLTWESQLAKGQLFRTIDRLHRAAIITFFSIVPFASIVVGYVHFGDFDVCATVVLVWNTLNVIAGVVVNALILRVLHH